MPETRKRVVLLHRSGLHRIIGVLDPSVHTVKDFIEFGIQRPDGSVEHTAASLLQVQTRYIVYRQVMAPPKSGKLGEFHPSQR